MCTAFPTPRDKYDFNRALFKLSLSLSLVLLNFWLVCHLICCSLFHGTISLLLVAQHKDLYCFWQYRKECVHALFQIKPGPLTELELLTLQSCLSPCTEFLYCFTGVRVWWGPDSPWVISLPYKQELEGGDGSPHLLGMPFLVWNLHPTSTGPVGG